MARRERMATTITTMTTITALLTILIITTTLIINTESAAADEMPSIGVINAELLYYKPVPVRPGDTIDAYIQLTNNGTEPTKPGTIKILDSFPFKPISKDYEVMNYPSIPPQNSFLIRTKIVTDKNANEGEAEVRIELDTGDGNIMKREFPINIVGRSSTLTITEAKTEPERISPGGEGIIKITAKNIGDTKLRNIRINLDLDEAIATPITTSNEQSIKELGGGDEWQTEFKIVANPSAESKTYQIPIKITYDDEQGTSHEETETIGIVINSDPELMIYPEKITYDDETHSGEVRIKFVNKGLGEIKLLEMRIPEKKLDSRIIIPSDNKESYIGNIDSDDYETETISFRTTTNEQEPTVITIPLIIKYKDSMNKEYEEEKALSIDLRNTGKKSSSSKSGIIILGVIIIAGAIYYFKRKKNPKKR